MKIGFLSSDWSTDFRNEEGHPTPGGAGWYRCHLPAKALNDHGVDAVVGAEFGLKPSGEIFIREWNGTEHHDLDIIVFQRWMDANAERVILTAKACGQVVVNDVDDWYDGLSTSNVAFRASHPRFGLTNEFGVPLNRSDARRLGDKRIFRENRDFYRKSLRASSALTVSTEFLAQNLRAVDVPIFVVPNAVDTAMFGATQTSRAEPVIGWIGSTMTRSGDLEVLKGILGPFCNRHGIRFHHSGHLDSAPRANELLGVDEELTTTEPMRDIYNYPQMFQAFDIGLVPLSSGKFNEAKSAIKGMEYAAAGVPFVASGSSSYRHLKDDYDIGLIADRPKDWIYHLERLLDPGFRLDTTNRIHEAVKALDVNNLWGNWLNAYLQSAAQPAGV